MTSNEVLSMKNIYKSFPGVVALDDITIHLYQNEIMSICGENGAGKSTLMKILSGVYPFGSYIIKNLNCSSLVAIWQT